MKLMHSLALTAFLTVPLLHAPAGAAAGEIVDMNHYLCKDIMRMSGEERGVALGVMHGYALGKKGTTSFKSTMPMHCRITSSSTAWTIRPPRRWSRFRS